MVDFYLQHVQNPGGFWVIFIFGAQQIDPSLEWNVVRVGPGFRGQGEVPDDEDFLIPLGVADVKREGTDLTIVTYGRCVLHSLAAAETIAIGRLIVADLEVANCRRRVIDENGAAVVTRHQAYP